MGRGLIRHYHRQPGNFVVASITNVVSMRVGNSHTQQLLNLTTDRCRFNNTNGVSMPDGNSHTQQQQLLKKNNSYGLQKKGD